MGQRLLVDIIRNNKSVAALYYHWSAYQKESVAVTKKIYEHVIKNADNMSDDELQLALIRFAELSTPQIVADNKIEREMHFAFIESQIKSSVKEELWELFIQLKCAHGGLAPDDLYLAQNKWPNKEFDQDESLSRSEGLVMINPDHIVNAKKMSSIVTIDITNKLLFSELFCGKSEDEYCEERDAVYEDCEDDCTNYPDIKDIEESPIDLSQYSFDQLSIVEDVVLNNAPQWLRFGDKIYWIE